MITNFILTPTKAFTYLRFVINKNISWEKRMKFLKKILSRTTTVLCIYRQTVFHPQSRRQQRDRGHGPPTFLHRKKNKRNKVKKETVLKQSYYKTVTKVKMLLLQPFQSAQNSEMLANWPIMVADRHFSVFHGPSTLISISPAPTRFIIFCYVLTLFFSIDFCQGKF